MIFFTSAQSKHLLSFKKLSECMACLPTAAQWIEGEWGYIRNKGIEYRTNALKGELCKNIYIGFFADRPVAMFGLFERPVQFRNKAAELMYVYVEKDYRGLGFGRQIINAAKRFATELGAELIMLDTLKPSLNRLYEKHGAEVVGEGQLFSHPTDILALSL